VIAVGYAANGVEGIPVNVSDHREISYVCWGCGRALL
jgi:hypothetical protein